MILSERIQAFQELKNSIKTQLEIAENPLFIQARNTNTWFTIESLRSSFEGLMRLLDSEKMGEWLSRYNISEESSELQVGLMLAGNIPAVGFHDLMCVLISGKKAAVKLSNADSVLMGWIISELMKIDDRFVEQISVEPILKGKDAYIATGSDNSSRYFDYYFGKYPHIIRRNRTSVAVLDGNESTEELEKLGIDIFTYFGLGCRNVSKLYVKEDFDLNSLLGALESYKYVADHHKYFNNYEYNKSIYLVNGTPHLDSGFLLLKEDDQIVSPISTLFYEQYEDQEDLLRKLGNDAEKIQCVVGKGEGLIPFGQAQFPLVDDYADGVDTMSFLTRLKEN